jgi:hypothetical protein
MYSTALLVTAIGYEIAKDRLHPDKLFPSIEGIIERHVPDHSAKAPCDGTILCERQGVRHKQDCIGRTVPINAYAKAIQ